MIYKKINLNDVGIVFISPIIGLTNSLISTFKPIVSEGASVIGVDVFDNSYEKRTFLKVIKLTLLPGAYSRRVSFANSFPEHMVFNKIRNAIEQFIQRGKTKIILGGMSGGFIFAARVVQHPTDHEIGGHDVLELNQYVTGLFGISPIIFYPTGVHRPDVNLDLIPSRVRTLLFFGDGDNIIPPGTIEYAEAISRKYNHIQVKCLRHEEFISNPRLIRHQFFGGRDFIGPLKNVFWHPEAEKRVLDIISNFLEEISSSNPI